MPITFDCPMFLMRPWIFDYTLQGARQPFKQVCAFHPCPIEQWRSVAGGLSSISRDTNDSDTAIESGLRLHFHFECGRVLGRRRRHGRERGSLLRVRNYSYFCVLSRYLCVISHISVPRYLLSPLSPYRNIIISFTCYCVASSKGHSDKQGDLIEII